MTTKKVNAHAVKPVRFSYVAGKKWMNRAAREKLQRLMQAVPQNNVVENGAVVGVSTKYVLSTSENGRTTIATMYEGKGLAPAKSTTAWRGRVGGRGPMIVETSAYGAAPRSIESILKPQSKDELLQQLDRRTKALLE